MKEVPMLEEAKEVCPTTTLRLLSEGAILIDVRDRSEVTAFAFDVPYVINIPLSELEQRWSEVPRERPLVTRPLPLAAADRNMPPLSAPRGTPCAHSTKAPVWLTIKK